MTSIASFSFPRRGPLLGLGALLIFLLSAATLLLVAAGQLDAQDGYQPDLQVVADVRTYAEETQHGYDHVLRWIRVLKTFGALDEMTATEAQGYADRGWQRWDPVVEELTNLEAQEDYEPDAQVVSDVRGYARETDYGFDHVHRWVRVLQTFGEIEDMTAAEAQGHADIHLAERWDPVVAELTAMEAATPSASGVAVSSDAGDDDTYALSDVIEVTLTFSEAVKITGAPRLTIKMAPNYGEKWASYERGSGTASLTFICTVVKPNLSTQGIAVLANTLELNGGTIQSASSQADADLSHAGLDHDPAHRVDTAAPVLASASVNGTALSVTFNETLDEDSAPAGSAFTAAARPGGGAARRVAGTGTARVDGAAVTVTLAEAVLGGDTVTVAYAPPGDGLVRDLPGNAAAAFSGEPVTNETPAVDPGAPRLSLTDATVRGATLTLAYDNHLHWNSVPNADAFAVTVTGNAASLAATRPVAVSTSKVTLTLAEAVSADDTVAVSYTADWWNPIASVLYDFGYRYAEDFTDLPVTNIMGDTTAPTLSAAAVNGKALTLAFDEQLDPDDEPAASAFSVTANGRPVGLRAWSLTTNGRPKPPLEDPVPSIIGASVLLSLVAPVGDGDAVVVGYTPSESGAKLQDLAGNEVATFEGAEAENRTETSPPRFRSATVEGTALVVTFNEPLDEGSAPVGSAFTVTAATAGSAVRVIAGTGQARVEDAAVAVTLAEAVQQGETVTVAYTPPGEDPIRDLAGKGATAFSGATATNEARTRSRRHTESNQAPVVNEQAEEYPWFTGNNNAPRGTLVSKPFYGIFSDPDGDELTYAVAITGGDSQLVDDLQITTEAGREPRTWPPYGTYYRVWFQPDGEDDWKSLSPPLPDRPVVTVTLTATDPEGLSASVSGDFVIGWESYPEVVSATADGQGIKLTFDWAVESSPAPGPEQFTVNVVNGDGSEGTIAVESVAVSGKVVRLELASALDESQTVTLDYAYDYHDDTPLQRAGGGDPAPGFTGQAVAFLRPPGEPANFAVSATAGQLSLLATWDTLEGATSYNLRWRLSGGKFHGDDAITVSGDLVVITVSGYGQWEVRLQGCNDAGCGPEVNRTVDVVQAIQLSLEPARDAEGNAPSRTINANWDPVPPPTPCACGGSLRMHRR